MKGWRNLSKKIGLPYNEDFDKLCQHERDIRQRQLEGPFLVSEMLVIPEMVQFGGRGLGKKAKEAGYSTWGRVYMPVFEPRTSRRAICKQWSF